MIRKLAPVVVAACTAALFLGPVRGQDPFQGFGKNKDQGHDWNVGPLGLTAALDGSGLSIRSVAAGGPAERAGLRTGETIKGAGGRPFAAKADPVIECVLACEAAEASAKKEAVVVLLVARDGQDVPVKVTLQGGSKHSASCPKKCKKCERAVASGAAFLLSKQAPDGHFPTDLGGKTGLVVVTSLSGLALLSVGGADPAVAKAAEYVVAKCGAKDDSPLKGFGGGGGGNWNQENWELGYGALFLAEVAKKTKRPDFKAKLEELVKRLEANQEASGGWAHGPGGPNSLGYLELEIMSNWVLMGLGGARRNGIALDKGKLEKAFSWIEATTSGNGGVGYSPREGQKGFGEAGRTSGAIAAFTLLDQRSPFFQKMVDFFRGKMRALSEGHVSPCMHLVSGAIASYQLGPRDWQAYVETYRPWIYAARRVDGSFAPTPTKESQALRSNTDATVGDCWTTASYVLILSLPNEKVPVLLDRGGAEKPGKGDKGDKGKSTTGAGAQPKVPDGPPPVNVGPDKPPTAGPRAPEAPKGEDE